MWLARAGLVTFAAFALFVAREAGAMCAPPRTAFSPPSGTMLPPNAEVYLFVIKHDEASPPIRLEVTGADFTAQRIATLPLYDVVRIALVASGEEVELRWGDKREHQTAVVRYPIGVAAPANAVVTGVTYTRNAWMCSFTNTIDVTLTSNAIAYRLVWSDGTSAMFPASLDLLWVGPGEPSPDDVEPSSPRLAIGHVSCLGYTVEPKALQAQRDFRLVALFADGEVRQLGTARAQLAPDLVRLPWELLPAAQRPLQPQAFWVPQNLRGGSVLTTRPLPSSDSLGWSMIGGLAAVAAAVAAAVLWHRRRVGNYLSPH